MVRKDKNSKVLLSLIFFVSLAMGGSLWAGEATSVGSADPGEGGEIFKSDGTALLICTQTQGGMGPVNGVKVSCNNPGGASICNGGGSSGGGKNKIPSRKPASGSVSGIQVSQEMFNCLNKIVPICAKKIGCSGNDIKFESMGGHANRVKNTMKGGSKSASKHCGGFAIDFTSIQCSGSGGEKLELTQAGRAKDQEKYDSFRNCWDAEVENNCDPLKQAINERFHPGRDYVNSFYSLFLSLIEPAHAGANGKHSIACVGAPKPANAKHNDHMHGSIDTESGQPSGI